MTTNRFLSGAQWYAQNGWSVLACHGIDPATGICTCGQRHGDPKDIGKHPATTNGHLSATRDPSAIDAWWRVNPNYNVGVNAQDSGYVVLDIDPRNNGWEGFAKLENMLGGNIPITPTAITGSYNVAGTVSRGRHLYFNAPEGMTFNGKIDGVPGIDIKHNGYLLLPPSRHISGVEYEWVPGRAPWEIAVADLTDDMISLMAKRRSGGGQKYSSRVLGKDSAWDFIYDLDWGKSDPIDIDAFLEEGIDEGQRAVEVYRLTCAIANRYPVIDGLARNAIETLMVKFNFEKIRPPLELEGPGGLLSHVHRAIDFVAANPKIDYNKKMIGLGQTVLRNVTGGAQHTPEIEVPAHLTQTPAPTAASEGWADEDSVETAEGDFDYEDYAVNMSQDADALREEEGGQEGGRTLTDMGNGRRFVDSYKRVVRFTPSLGWFFWNGEYWKPDNEDLEVRELAKNLAAIVGAEASQSLTPDEQKAYMSWAKQSKSNARQKAAIESAQSDPRIIVPIEHWDNNPTLLGVKNGVIDLRTGQLLKGRPDLHITRRAPVAYTPGKVDQRFQEFLNTATNGDIEYQEWLQRAFGYTLTGLRTYDHLYLVYGPPGTGKNVMVEAFVKLLGAKQYAFSLDPTILTSDDGKASRTDEYHWAELRGRRMVWVDELPESGRLKENSVKRLTGSSEISARSPGEKPFTFDSQGKLWITTNHRPIITDDAMWRRIRPIPWMVQPATPDPTLKQYLHDLEGGLPAILAWGVEGAVKLLASNEPDAIGWCKVVEEAAEMYRKNEDRMGMFLNEETEEAPGEYVTIKNLYMVYYTWSSDRGERPMSQIALHRKLTERGVSVHGEGGKAIVMNRRLRPVEPAGIESHDWTMLLRTAN